MRSTVVTRSIARSNEAMRATPVLSADATRYASAKSIRADSYTSTARRSSGGSRQRIDPHATSEPMGGRDLVARGFVERLEDVNGLGCDDVGQEEFGAQRREMPLRARPFLGDRRSGVEC